MQLKPRCGKPMPRSTVCGRPDGHGTHCLSVEAIETMRRRNARGIAAMRLLEAYEALSRKSS